MANELALNLSLAFSKAGVAPVNMGSGAIALSVRGSDYIRSTESVTITPKPLVLCEGTPGYCVIRNTDTAVNALTHYVLVSATADSTTPLMMLRPGEWAVFRLNSDPAVVPHVQMNPGLTSPGDPTSIRIEYLIIAD